MSPAELKDTLRQTFHMKLAPAQVGALAHLFGNDDGPGNGDVFEGGTPVSHVARVFFSGMQRFALWCFRLSETCCFSSLLLQLLLVQVAAKLCPRMHKGYEP